MTNDQLGKALVASGLMPVGEVKSIWSEIPAEQRPKDAKSFAELLIEKGKLSKFQAAELLSGSNTPLILGDYQLQAKIGAGGMGQVFKAQHRHMKRTVAIKLLPAELTKDEGAIKRFQREVEAAAKLSHPNIVQAHDASVQRNIWYLVMEYVEGHDLAGIVAAEGSLPIARAVNYIRQSARGLGFAHENGVVHRDIKPANLLLDKKGTIKILDMGLARFDDGMAAQEGLTQSGQVMGTVDYMAPEQAFDTRHADARADIYSLGCTLFRLLTAQNMYEGESLVQKLMGHQSKPIPKLSKARPDVPPQLEVIFERMVAKDPKERYQTMAEVLTALAPFEDPSKAAGDGGGLTGVFEGLGGGSSGNSALLAQPTSAQVLPSTVMPTISLNNPLQSTDPVSARSIQIARDSKPQLGAIKRPPGNRKKLLIAAGGLGGLLAVLLGIWVIIKDKDGKEVARVAVPEGGTATVQASNVPATTTSTAAPTYELVFDGSGQATVPSVDWKTLNTFTMECWVRSDQKKADDKAAFLMDWKRRANLHYIKERYAFSVHYLEAPEPSYARSVNELELGKWNHLAGVYKDSVLTLYVNGQKVESKRLAGQLQTQFGESFHFGRLLNGAIRDVRVSRVARYDGNFSPPGPHTPDAETVVLFPCRQMEAGDKVSDTSGNNLHATFVGAKWVKVDGESSGAPKLSKLELSGQQNQLSVDPLPLDATGEFTLEGTFEPGKQTTAYAFFLTKGPISLGFSPDAFKNQSLYAIADFPNDRVFVNTGVTMKSLEGKKVRVAMTWSPKGYQAFVDGKRVCNQPVSKRFDNPIDSLSIAAGMEGIVHEVRCSKGVRYTSDYTPEQTLKTDKDTIALYRLDEGLGDILRDSSGNNHHGKITGAKWVKTASEPTFTLHFDDKSIVQLPNTIQLDATKPFTLEARIVLDKEINTGTVAVVSDVMHNHLEIWEKTIPAMLLYNTSGKTQLQSKLGSLKTGRPYYLAAVRTENEFLLFVDGIVAVRQTIKDPSISESSPKPAWKIGGGYKNAFEGTISEVRLSSTARYTQDYTVMPRLTADKDTLALYHCDQGEGEILRDSSGQANHGKIVGAMWVKSSETIAAPPLSSTRENYALQFVSPGKGAELPVPLEGLGDYTIEGWATPEKLNEFSHMLSGENVLVRIMPPGTQSPFYKLGGGFIYVDENQKTAVMELQSKDAVEVGQPIHFAIQRKAGKIRLFENGSECLRQGHHGTASNPQQYWQKNFPIRTEALKLNGNPDLLYMGVMDEIRISRGARYDGSFTPAKRFEPDRDTLALYHFDEGTGDILKDSSGNNHHGKITGAKWVRIDAPATPSPASKAALDFSGSTAPGTPRVELPKIIDVAKPLTVEMFVTPRTRDGKNRLLFAAEGQAILRIWGNNVLDWSGPAKQGTENRVLAYDKLPLGKRSHVAAVSTGSNLRLFINGQEIGRSRVVMPEVIKRASIGGQSYEDGTWQPFDGTIDEVRISTTARYDSSFTPPTVLTTDKDTLGLYNFDEGQGDELKDSSGNNHHGKIVGAKWVKADGAAELAAGLRFEGPGHYMDGKLDFPIHKPWTVEAWATVLKAPPVGERWFVIAGSHSTFTLLHDEKTGLCWNGKAQAVLGQQTHLALVHESGDVQLFVDGVPQDKSKLFRSKNDEAEARISPGPSDWSASGGRLGFDGILSEVRISSTARYQQAFTPKRRWANDKETIALYRFDEGQGNTLTDSSGNGSHFKIVGAKWVKSEGLLASPIPADYALQFASGDYVKLQNELDYRPDSFTIEAFVKPEQSVSNAAVYVVGGQNGILLDPDDGKSWRFSHAHKPSGFFGIQEKPSIELQRRVHLAAVSSPSGLSFYIDGKLAGKSAKSRAHLINELVTHRGPPRLGEKFIGQIDEIRVSRIPRYNADFTPPTRHSSDADTLALYHMDEGEGDILKDSSGNNHHGKIVGAKWVKTDGTPSKSPQQMALRFAKRGPNDWDKVHIPSLFPDLTLPCTVEGYVTAYDNSEINYPILSDGGWNIRGDTHWSAGGTAEDSKGQRSAKGITARGTTKVVLGQRTHLALVSTGRQFRLYVDGVLSGQADFGDLSLDKAKRILTLGRGFNGDLTEVRVSKVARYNQPFMPVKRFTSDSDTVALYHFDEGEGDVLHDSSGNNHHGKIIGAKWMRAADQAPAIDLLPLVRVNNPTRSNPWKRDAQGILIPGDGYARTQIDAVVPEEYELLVEATPISGSKSLILGLSRAGQRFWIPVSGWNNAHTKLEPMPTTGSGQTESKALRLEDNKPVTLVCTVRRDGVKLVGNDQTLIDWQGDTTTLQPEWASWVLPEPDKLALGSWQGEIRVTRLELRPLGRSSATTASDGWLTLFDGKTLNGWETVGEGGWSATDGVLKAAGTGKGWIGTTRNFKDYELELEYRIQANGNGGIGLRAWKSAGVSMKPYFEVQIIDDKATPTSHPTGSITDHVVAKPGFQAPLGEWNKVTVRLEGKHALVKFNGTTTVDADLPIEKPEGMIALQVWDKPVEYRNIRVRELNKASINGANATPKTIPAEALTFGGHRYLLVDSLGNWDQAKAKAEAMGGHLATVTSKEELDWLRENIVGKRASLPEGIFIGGEATDDVWSWITGEPFDKKLWLGFATEKKKGRSCLCWNSTFNWNSAWPLTEMRYFLAEWDTLGPAVSAAATLDLLPLIDPALDSVKGTWARNGGDLTTEVVAHAVIEAPYEPPEEYDLIYEFTRLTGNSDVSVMLSRAGQAFGYCSAQGGFNYGISLVDGTPAFTAHPEIRLENGRKYRAKVEVRRDRLSGYLDDRLVSELNTEGKTLNPYPGTKLRKASLVGLTAYGGKVTFHRLQIVEVTGQGKLLRPAANGSAVTDPQRRAAEWVLSKGGLIVCDGSTKIADLKDLPAGPLQVTQVSLHGKGLSLEDINLAPLRDLPQLKFLSVYGSTASPEGIAGLERLPQLERLSWGMLNLDDKAVAAIARLKHLSSLYCAGSTIRPGQLQALAQAAPNLTSINLQNTKLKDEQGGRPLDDATILALSEFKKLKQVQLQGTAVTAAGVAALQKALPNCVIEWDDPAKGAGAAAKPWEAPAFQQWIIDTQKLPADKQLEAVSKKLMELNPGFDGKLTGLGNKGAPKIENGVVTECAFFADNVTDISPLRAFAGLSRLGCVGSTGKAKLSRLSPLAGMKLTRLECFNTRVGDLSVFSGMDVKELLLGNTDVTDLTTLETCPQLKYIYAKSTKVTASAVANFKAKMPNCNIEWDDPTKVPSPK